LVSEYLMDGAMQSISPIRITIAPPPSLPIPDESQSPPGRQRRRGDALHLGFRAMLAHLSLFGIW
jgi:hypothetical protein